jgi:hypothetical protein
VTVAGILTGGLDVGIAWQRGGACAVTLAKEGNLRFDKHFDMPLAKNRVFEAKKEVFC